ncbi:DUF6650 family protein [Isoptericola sp. QY 916]|uniref:DUF6650 family protein n=1 Tax=Isoptericola sp. QY 916 TaxID=2782570 RepID=UPI003D2FD3B2|nr:hypothetical protein [Isoptericola sp. QY 916]
MRITGVSTAVGGTQWEYLKSDAEIARRVIRILEDHRMLWQSMAMEVPAYAIASASDARKALTQELMTEGIGRDLELLLRQIRKLFMNFMTFAESGVGSEIAFVEALTVLRTAVGERLAALVAMYELDVDEDLRSIIPDSGAWFFKEFKPDG